MPARGYSVLMEINDSVIKQIAEDIHALRVYFVDEPKIDAAVRAAISREYLKKYFGVPDGS